MASLLGQGVGQAAGLSFASGFLPGLSGVLVMVSAGIIDAKIAGSLGDDNANKNRAPKMLDMPANSVGEGAPRVIAYGNRVRVPVHVLWQSSKTRDVNTRTKMGMGPSASQRQVLVDCALAVNDRLTQKLSQLIANGKLLIWDTRNLIGVRTSGIVVTQGGGNLILTMVSAEEEDWSTSFVVDDVTVLLGFVPVGATPNINVGFWRVVTVTTHLPGAPSVLTLSPYSGQSLVGLNSNAGTEADPARVLREDGSVVHHSYSAARFLVGPGGVNYPNGLHDPTANVPPGGMQLIASPASRPKFDELFSIGDKVRLRNFTCTVTSGNPAFNNLHLTRFVVRMMSSTQLILRVDGGTPSIPSYVTVNLGTGTSTNASIVEFWDQQFSYTNVLPTGFIPSQHFYRGTEEQLPDPTIEAIETVGNVPSFRGVAYQVIERMNVTSFGNSLPSMLEALIEPDENLDWASAFALVCERHGIKPEHVDTSGIDARPFDGFYLRGRTSGVIAIAPLMVAGQIVNQDRDGVQCFFQIENADSVRIVNGGLESHLGTRAFGDVRADDKIARKDKAFEDLPTSVSVRHQDPDNIYAEGFQQYGLRYPTASDNEQRVDANLTNLVLSRKRAMDLATTIMRRTHVNGREFSASLPPNYSHLLENDLVTLTDDDGNDLTGRIIRRDIGSNGIVQITCVEEDVQLAVTGSPTQGRAGLPQQEFVPVLEVDGVVLDMPSTSSHDGLLPGVVVAGAPRAITGAWGGCTVYVSSNAGADWTLATQLGQPSCTGLTDVDLAAGVPGETHGTTVLNWDPAAFVTVILTAEGAIPPVSFTEAEVIAGFGWYALQDPATGDVEIIGVKDVQQTAPGEYIFSYLLRGLRGTKNRTWLSGTRITQVSLLAQLTGAFVNLSAHLLQPVLEFRFVPPGKSVTEVESVPLVFKFRNVRPLPVRDVTKVIAGGTNVVRFYVAHWTRTFFPLGYAGPYPMDETFEEYKLKLYDKTGSAVVFTRTITARGTGSGKLRDRWFEFTTAEQQAAGYTPGPSETFTVDVVQVGNHGESPSNVRTL